MKGKKVQLLGEFSTEISGNLKVITPPNVTFTPENSWPFFCWPTIFLAGVAFGRVITLKFPQKYDFNSLDPKTPKDRLPNLVHWPGEIETWRFCRVFSGVIFDGPLLNCQEHFLAPNKGLEKIT